MRRLPRRGHHHPPATRPHLPRAFVGSPPSLPPTTHRSHSRGCARQSPRRCRTRRARTRPPRCTCSAAATATPHLPCPHRCHVSPAPSPPPTALPGPPPHGGSGFMGGCRPYGHTEMVPWPRSFGGQPPLVGTLLTLSHLPASEEARASRSSVSNRPRPMMTRMSLRLAGGPPCQVVR